MPSKLAAAIRAKHPGVYDNVDDATLEKAVLAKYPQYASLAQPDPVKSNAGMSTGDLQAANLKDRPDLPSAAGFASNVGSSGVKFAKDAVTGIPSMLGMLGSIVRASVDPQYRTQQAMTVGEAAPGALQAAGQAIKGRYGSVDNALSTAYHDPAGVAVDASTVAGGAGLAAKAGGASKIARVLEAVSEAANPLSIPGRALESATHGAANVAVRATLRPSAALREDFGGGKAMADAVLKDRVYSAANAQKKLSGSVAEADKMLADAQAAGVPGVSRVAVAKSVLGEPQKTAKLRTRLGVPDATPELTDTAKAIFKNNPSDIPLTEAQSMKREAQKLAYEAGSDNLAVKKAAEQAKAGALRSGIEDRVPEVGPVNERSQRLLGSQQAFQSAEDRPQALTNFFSIINALGGGAVGGPVGAIASAGLTKAIGSPRAGAMAGIGMNTFGQGMNANTLRQAALVARLLGESQQ